MSMLSRSRILTVSLCMASLMGLVASATSAAAQGDVTGGAAEFRNSCAPCHGADAQGNGPIAYFLKVKPTDLTMLAKNNNGEYPFLKVFQTIDGRTVVKGHGDRAMPIWGDRYEAKTGVPPNTYASETMVRARVLELVYYIQTIQQK
jgi:mono/diheme cytochrome c family protein